MIAIFDQPYRVPLGNTENFQIILVGCGGTGGYIAEALARLSWHLNQTGKTMHLVFVDPDNVEENNIGRQRFAPAELGLNKSVCLANRYNIAFGLEISSVERPFETQMIQEWINPYRNEQNTLLIGAVDNPEARQEMAQAVEKSSGRLWCLDAGNAMHNGNVYIGNLTDAADLKLNSDLMLANGLPSPFVQHSQLVKPVKRRKQERVSCATLIVQNEQSLIVNQQMGALMTRYLECWLIERELTFMHTAVSLEIPSMQTTLSTDMNLKKVWG